MVPYFTKGYAIHQYLVALNVILLRFQHKFIKGTEADLEIKVACRSGNRLS